VKDPKKLFNTHLDCKTVHAFNFQEDDPVDEAVLQALILDAVGLSQPQGALERICYAYDSSMRPNGDSRWFGGFFPFHFFDHGRIGFLDHSAQL
jgi:hypothetical protein